MAVYNSVVYRQYGHLLADYFGKLKSIFKNEVYKGAHTIYLPHHFKNIYPFVETPLNAVAVLWMSFEYDAMDGKREHMRYCFLDTSGYRIPDNSVREFNDRVDAWLEKIYELRINTAKWIGS